MILDSIKATLVDLFVIENYVLFIHCYTMWKKSEIFFIIIYISCE